MNTGKEMQEWSGLGRSLTDLEARILELFYQLSKPQRRLLILSAVLSTAASDMEAQNG